jgi:hypothetical protein
MTGLPLPREPSTGINITNFTSHFGELSTSAFCQVTGFSRPGNRDEYADRLPAAPPGVMVVQTAGKHPGNNPEYPGTGKSLEKE